MIILYSTGNVLCNPDNPVRVSTSLEARVIVFDVEIPITMGYPVRILILQVTGKKNSSNVKGCSDGTSVNSEDCLASMSMW